MSYNKLQGQRAADVTPRNLVDIIAPWNAPVVFGIGTNSSGDTYDFTGILAADWEDKWNIGWVIPLTTGGVTYTARQLSFNFTSGYLQVTFDRNYSFLASGFWYTTLELNEGCVLYIGTGGNVSVETIEGDDVIFNGVVGGTFLPVLCRKVTASNTTASNIIAIW